MASQIVSSTTGQGLRFDILLGSVPLIGDRGYSWQVPGLLTTGSNTKVTKTFRGATRATLTGISYDSALPSLLQARAKMQLLVLTQCILTDAFSVNHTVMLHSVETMIKRGKHAFGGKTYPYRIECTLDIESLT